MQRQAFSLLETVVVTGVVTTLAAIGVVQWRMAARSAERAGLAAQLSADLKLCRQAALQQGVAWGVGIPSDAGTTPFTQSYYLLRGNARGRVQSVQRFQDSSGPALFSGHWPGLTPLSAPPQDSAQPDWDPATWNSGRPQDRLLLFTPGGDVLSNAPRLGRDFALLLCHGGEAVPDAPGFALSRVSRPLTLLVSPRGAVRQQPGAGTTPEIPESPIGRFAAPPTPEGGPNHPPQLLAPFLDTAPAANPATLAVAGAPGSTLTLKADGVLGLSVFAHDSDDDALQVEWTAQGPGSKTGNFHGPAQDRMVYEPKTHRWRANISWSPAADALPGELYQLNCTVRDGRGGSTTLADVGVQLPAVSILQPGRICYTSEVSPNHWGVVVGNWDGTDARQLVTPEDSYTGGRWSPDGRWLLLGYQGRLYLLSPDGRKSRLIAILPSGAGYDWAPNGLSVYAVGNRYPQYDLYRVFDLSGTNPNTSYVRLDTQNFGMFQGAGSGVINVHPNGKRLWVGHGDSAESFVHEYAIDPRPANPATSPAVHRILPLAHPIGCFHFHPQASDPRVSFSFSFGGLVWLGDYAPVDAGNPDGDWQMSNERSIPNSRDISAPCWSPDGSWMLGDDTSGPGHRQLEAISPAGSNRMRITSHIQFPGQTEPGGEGADWSF